MNTIWLAIDIDHTLLRTEQFQYQAWKKVLHSSMSFSQEEYSTKYCWRWSREIAQELAAIMSIDPEKFYADRMKKLDHILEQQQEFSLMPEVEKFFSYIRQNKIPYALVTWGSEKESIDKINKSPLRHIFSQEKIPLVSKDDYVHSKPNPEPYIIGKQKLQELPGGSHITKFVAFEDTLAWMLSALDAGYDAIHIIPHKWSKLSFDEYIHEHWLPKNVIQLKSLADYKL